MIVLFPMIVNVSPFSNFRSWGSPEITDPGNILQLFPILAPGKIVTFDPIQQLSPISTFS